MEEKCFHKDVLKKGIDYFSAFRLPNKGELVVWLLTTFCLVLLVVIVGVAYIRENRRVCMLMQEAQKLEQQTADLLEQRREAITKLGGNALGKFVALFDSLCYIVPSQSWIERLSYAPAAPKPITLEGISPNYKEILSFYTALLKQGILKDCSLGYQSQTSSFAFSIQGVMKR